ncbi:MAG: hypothetical protein V1725_07230 [archaeon]
MHDIKCWTRMGEYHYFLDNNVSTPYTRPRVGKRLPFTPAFCKLNDKRGIPTKLGHVYYIDDSPEHTLEKTGKTETLDWVVQEAIETPDTLPCDLKILFHKQKGIVFSYAKFDRKKIVYRQFGARYIKLFPYLDGPLTEEAKTALTAMHIDPGTLAIPTELRDIVQTIAPGYHTLLSEQCRARFNLEFKSKVISFDFKYGVSASHAANHKPYLHSPEKPQWYAIEINSCPDSIAAQTFLQYQSLPRRILRFFGF